MKAIGPDHHMRERAGSHLITMGGSSSMDIGMVRTDTSSMTIDGTATMTEISMTTIMIMATVTIARLRLCISPKPPRKT